MISLRSLIGLFINLLMLPILLLSLSISSNLKPDYTNISDDIAIMKLRELLLITYDMEIDSNKLSFTYQNDSFRLSEINNKLILQPGTVIYLNDIEDSYFLIEDNNIYISYKKGGKNYKKILTKKESLHINDFSDCLNQYLEPDIDDE